MGDGEETRDSPQLLTFHHRHCPERPREIRTTMCTHHQLDIAAITGISEQTRQCLQRLQEHEAEMVDLSTRPKSRLAAVLVLLYETAGQLRVLLTTRSKSLRTHPGQTALPGGKVDESDVDLTHTAYREAFEEVGLPLNTPHLHAICTLRPFISSSKLLVTPIVAFLDDPSLLNDLKPCEGEVEHIFTHPLEAILHPALIAQEPLAVKGGEDWPYEADFYNPSDVELPWLGNSSYRMHRFRSSASPIKGLTAEILIMTATIAYDRPPTFEQYALRQFVRINDVLRILDQQHPASPMHTGAETTGISTPAEVVVQPTNGPPL
ncbi:NUDIX hydrolase domain-like protein [Cristinia sonorae]|uniref:NUDIX hydrolase domain-like protein n=1 Tax=Cristinia sonorae TaxID=1940300 RepID=A0A8K0ULD7_9AGAR|nr:NUDIX hydrolase domain-like protein [Cristinia sonorae]